MNGTPSARVSSFSRPATSICSSRDSTTHGPAMRKSGLSRPASKPQSFTLRRLRECRPGAERGRAGEALRHAGIHTSAKINIHYFDSEELEKTGTAGLEKMDAILVPGGFGKRGTEGKIAAIRYARENGVPYLGICLGMQLATIEFARNVCGLAGANSTEFDPDTPHPVVALITEWLDRTGRIEKRSEKSDFGGTMRLGAQKCPVEKDTLAFSIYGPEVNERHRHRYEVNNVYVPELEARGYKVSARTPSERLPEIMELPGHPFFVGVQFHPEFTSTPRQSHPLFKAYVAAALRHRAREKRPLSVVAA